MQQFTVADIVAATGSPRFREGMESAFAPARLPDFVSPFGADGLPLEASMDGDRLRAVEPAASGEGVSIGLVIYYDRIVAIGISLVLQALNVSSREMDAVAAQIDEGERARLEIAAQFEGFNLGALLKGVDVDLKAD